MIIISQWLNMDPDRLLLTGHQCECFDDQCSNKNHPDSTSCIEDACFVCHVSDEFFSENVFVCHRCIDYYAGNAITHKWVFDRMITKQP